MPCARPPSMIIMCPPKPASLEDSSPRMTTLRVRSPTSARSSTSWPWSVWTRAPVRVVERLVQLEDVAVDARDRAFLIVLAPVVGRCDHDPVAGMPDRRFRKFDRVVAGIGVVSQVRPRPHLPAVQLEGPAHHTQHLRAHIHDVSVGVVAGKGDHRVLREWFLGGTDAERAVHDDHGRQLDVLPSERERAVDLEPIQSRGRRVQHDLGAGGDRHAVAGVEMAPPHVAGSDQRVRPIDAATSVTRAKGGRAGCTTRVADASA